MKYRPEIDGLRAVAVLLVLLYHAEFAIDGHAEWFQRANIGVDIFFVISGYLITSIILKEMRETGGFSFWNFYERRARRILPALFFMILATFPAAFRVLNPMELTTYLYSVVSTVFFSSNIFFYLESVNFGPESAEIEPLLHSWSLAIEEQFYLIFPVILLVVMRYFPRYLLSIFIILFFLSIQFSELAGPRFEDFNFLLLLSRFWELLAGAMLAHLELEYGRSRSPFLNAVMPAVGACMIGWYLLQFFDYTVHPGFKTVVPVLGTVLIIAFASREDLTGRILGLRPLVGVGLISYSLYLWHFPVMVYLDRLQPAAGNMEKLGWLVLSLVLAVISYFLVEQPFRNRKYVGGKSLYISLTLAVLLILSLSFFGDPVRIASL